MCASGWQFRGFESSDDRHAVFLNKVLSVDMHPKPREIPNEPDATHARTLIRELDHEKSTEVRILAEHRSVERQIADSRTTWLKVGMKRKFTSCPMQEAYLAQDDPSIADAVRSLTGRMSSLSAADLSWSIRRPRMISCLRQCLNRSEYTWALIMLSVHSQGRSATGLATLPGRHCAVSSLRLRFPAENLMARLVTRLCSRTWDVKACFATWVFQVNLDVVSDSSAARGLIVIQARPGACATPPDEAPVGARASS